MTAPSSERLALELEKAGLPAMAYKARLDHYHDFLSPDDQPEPSMALDADLLAAGTPAAMALRKRHHAGEFDAPKAESDAWAASAEGQAAFAELTKRPPPPSYGTTEPGRIAFRQEGEQWVAYYALTGTMEGAIWLGATTMRVGEVPEAKRHFIEAMKALVAAILKGVTGQKPTKWHTRPGPEGERSGRA